MAMTTDQAMQMIGGMAQQMNNLMQSNQQMATTVAGLLQVQQQAAAAAAAAPSNTPVPPGLGGGPQVRFLTEKGMKRTVFSGNMGEYENWAFGFETGIAAQSSVLEELMLQWKNSEVNIFEVDDLSSEEQRLSKMLYQMIVMLTDGEAHAIVKSVPHKEGLTAWQTLYKKYNPITLSRGLQLGKEVLRPGQVSDYKQVEIRVIKWEEKMKELKIKYNEEVSNNFRIGIFQEMLPQYYQEWMTMNMGKDPQYTDIREKVFIMIKNRVEKVTGYAPMQVDNVAGHQEAGHEGGEEWGDEDHQDVDVVVTSETKCFRCQGFGHTTATCGTPKGKGKGGKGDGKGGSKGGKSGFPYGGKGGFAPGKGASKGGTKGGQGGFPNSPNYKGICWTCGQQGHTSRDCKSKAVHEVGVEEGEEAAKTQFAEKEEEGVCQSVWVMGIGDTKEVDNKEWPKIGDQGAELKAAAMEKNSTVTNSINDKEFNDIWNTTNDENYVSWTDVESTEFKTKLSRNQQKKANKKKSVSIGAVFVRGRQIKMGNKFAPLDEDDIEICEVKEEQDKFTRQAALKFNVTDVKKTLASASRVVAAGNRIVMDPRPEFSYIENIDTLEKMKLRVEGGVYVFDVVYNDGTAGTITLDSGAGVHVMPKGLQKMVEMQPKQVGLKLSAANGTTIENLGTKVLKFKGMKPAFSRRV